MSFICRSATCPESTQNASGTPTVMPTTTDSVDMAGPSPSSSLPHSLVSPSLSASSSEQPSSSLPSSSLPPSLPPSPLPLAPPPSSPSLSSSPPSPTITTEATISSSESASASSSSSASASSSPSTVPNALSSSSSHSSPPVLKTLIIVTPSLIILFILIAFIITIYLQRKRRFSRLYGSSGSIFVGSNNRRQKQPLLSKFGLKSGSNRISRLDSKDSLSATTPVLVPASAPETAFAPEFAPALIPKPENVYEKRGRNTHQRASTVLQFEAMHPHVVLVNEDGNNSRESILIAVDGRNQDCRMVKVLQIDNDDKKKECWWRV